MKTLALQGIEPNGGGALSSNISKLGSKEVSKICHLERSERSKTHPNLPLKREGTIRHAELVSASQSNEVSKEVSKNLRNFPLAPWGEGVRRTGEGYIQSQQ